MTNIEIKIKNLFEELNNSEQKVASYLLSNVESVFTMPISQLAKDSGVSQVAWVRFCKTMGFTGLKEMKKEIFNELSEANDDSLSSSEHVFTDIKDYNTISQMKESIRNSSTQAISQTIRLVNDDNIKMIAQKIVLCDTVKIFGVGASALVGEDLFNKLIRINKNACYCRDTHVQLTYAANLCENDVAIIISYSGQTKEMIEILEIAKRQKAFVVAITKFGKNPLALRAENVIYTATSEIHRRSGAMSSRIAQLTIVDLLYTAVANNGYDKIEQSLENSYQSCNKHKVTTKYKTSRKKQN